MDTGNERQGSQAQRDFAGAADYVKQGADNLRHGANEQAEAATGRIGEGAEHVADAVRTAAESLRGKEEWLADAADALGQTIEQLSAAVRRKGAQGIRRDVEQLARQRPVLFMTTAVTVGIALGRLLRSTPVETGASGDAGRREWREPAAPAGGSYESY